VPGKTIKRRLEEHDRDLASDDVRYSQPRGEWLAALTSKTPRSKESQLNSENVPFHDREVRSTSPSTANLLPSEIST
jgi:hypothetical protein